MLRFLLISVICIVVLFHYYDNFKTYILLKSNTSKTTGIIVDYYEIGLSSFYMKYSYTVNGDVYTKTVNPDKLFDNCEEDKKCINSKIYVLYSKKEPSVSKPIFDMKGDE
ncbi:hypothetical protein [Flavobacterium panacagri]|uniref:hypothetical protein n=1 Tax=Flavobacterium panacagri TaxID=3034146 RepID=UPI0025A5395B|nr:hypothetical protein [Flavobacterium panacagri]